MPLALKVLVDTVTPALNRLAEGKLADIIQGELDISGQNMKGVAQSIVPVRTGYLQSTIDYSVDDLELALFATADYAAYVEFGTRYMAAEPYLRPAYDGEWNGLQDGIAAAVLNAWAQTA